MTYKKGKRPRNKRVVLIILLFLIAAYSITCYVRRTYGDLLSVHYSLAKRMLNIPDDTSCFYRDMEKPDSLEGIAKHAIFLISASCDSGLNMHHACAIEAVTRAHIDRTVYVLHNSPLKDCPCSEGLHDGLKSIPTVTFLRINIDKFVENTPLKGIFNDKFLEIGSRRHRRIIEVLKFAVLYKFGGVVIDLDMIMAKPVSFLGPNWGVKVNKSILGSAVIGLDKDSLLGKQILPLILENLIKQRNDWDIDGGKSLTDAFKRLCYKDAAVGCSDFRIYDTKYFYPINETSSHLYYQKGYLDSIAYGYYIWDTRRIRRSKGSIYMQLMKEYCPSVITYF